MLRFCFFDVRPGSSNSPACRGILAARVDHVSVLWGLSLNAVPIVTIGVRGGIVLA